MNWLQKVADRISIERLTFNTLDAISQLIPGEWKIDYIDASGGPKGNRQLDGQFSVKTEKAWTTSNPNFWDLDIDGYEATIFYEVKKNFNMPRDYIEPSLGKPDTVETNPVTSYDTDFGHGLLRMYFVPYVIINGRRKAIKTDKHEIWGVIEADTPEEIANLFEYAINTGEI